MDAIRERFLRDRVCTATPAQRVVMLYDRLVLDLARARTGGEADAETDGHLGHASEILAELLGSLDQSAGGPADNLAALYGYLLREIMQIRLGGTTRGLVPLESLVWTLRDAWAAIAAGNVAEVHHASPGLAGMSWTA